MNGLLLKDRRIDFKEVYGDEFESPLRNLQKYFAKRGAKSFGCRLVDARQAVPRELVNFLLKDKDQTGLQNVLTITEDLLALPAHVRRRFIAKGPLEGRGGKKHSSAYHGYLWDEQVSWLFISHEYNLQPENAPNPESKIGGRYVRLEPVRVSTPEEYAEIQAKFSGTSG